MGLLVQTLLPFLFMGLMGTSMFVVSRGLSAHSCHSREGSAFGFYRHAPFAIMAFLAAAAFILYGNDAAELGLFKNNSTFSRLTTQMLHQPGPVALILLGSVAALYLEDVLRS